MTDTLAQAKDRWAGRAAVITGAAGGLGSAFAHVATSIGMPVVLSDVDEPGLDAVADRVRAAGGRADHGRDRRARPRRRQGSGHKSGPPRRPVDGLLSAYPRGL